MLPLDLIFENFPQYIRNVVYNNPTNTEEVYPVSKIKQHTASQMCMIADPLLLTTV